jgi:heme ABC exporter ATP-binding subunit CcmA/heme exporter protein CcmB
MIDANALTKTFGPRVALDGIRLHVDPGEFVTLVGPNGAGKTTFLRILASLARPTSGRVLVAGQDMARAGPAVHRQIGYLSHRTLIYDDLTAEQNLRFYARLYGLSDAEARITELLERVDLTARRRDLVRTYSRGMQQRLAVARSVLHRPRLLLLDEPYAGLDPLAVDALTALLSDLSESGCTLLLTTHDLSARFTAGRRIVMLRQGRIVYDGVGDAAFLDRYRDLAMGEGEPAASLPADSEVRAAGEVRAHGPAAQPDAGAGERVGAVPGFLGQVGAIVTKDLAAELHTREIISAMFVFAVLALFIFSFALDLRGALAVAAAPGVLWSTIAFAGTLGLSRSMAREHQTGGMEGLLVAPVDRVSIFFGKALGSLLLMIIVELVLVPLTVAFFNVPLLHGGVLLALLLGTLGYAAVGTLLSAIAVNTRAREVMLPILLLPMLVPLLLAAVQTTRGLIDGAAWADLGGWTRILVVYDLIVTAVAMVTFGYTLEA